jgi:hypothetical protein
MHQRNSDAKDATVTISVETALTGTQFVLADLLVTPPKLAETEECQDKMRPQELIPQLTQLPLILNRIVHE